MDEILQLIDRIDRIKRAVCRGHDPLHGDAQRAFGEDYLARFAQAVSHVETELSRVVRERRHAYYQARRQHGDDSAQARSLYFEYGFARQTIKDLEHFEELATARVAAG